MKKLFLILFSSLFFACNVSEKKVSNSPDQKIYIDSIFITYFCGKIDTNEAIKCEKIASIQATHPINDYSLVNEGLVELIDTFIVDKRKIKQIETLLNNRVNIKKSNEDARMYITIKYINRDISDNICIGVQCFDVFFNGIPTQIDEKLVYLFRLYSGYYDWFDNNELSCFKEYKRFNYIKN